MASWLENGSFTRAYPFHWSRKPVFSSRSVHEKDASGHTLPPAPARIPYAKGIAESFSQMPTGRPPTSAVAAGCPSIEPSGAIVNWMPSRESLSFMALLL